MNNPSRNSIFISHATPEDNAFVLWLGAKLSAMGYDVWADVMRLQGGDDWSRKLEDALRNRAAKMLLVCTPVGLEKQGVRNEIQIGTDVSKKLDDPNFLIPLKLEKYDAPFLITHLQYIDFEKSWATGFHELQELIGTFQLQRRAPAALDSWIAAHIVGASPLLEKSEPLVSNWLEVIGQPKHIHYCEPPTGFEISKFQNRQLHKWPVVPYHAGVITFASPDESGVMSGTLPGKIVSTILTTEFVENGWAVLGMNSLDARRIYVDIGGQAFEKFCARRGLNGFMGGGKRLSWWPDIKMAPLSQVKFDWNFRRGSRKIIGHSPKRNIHWHYAMSAQLRAFPLLHYKLSARLVFSSNGIDAIADVRKSHTLRRSFAKGWRNARWRDMMCAYLWWISDGSGSLNLNVSEDEALSAKVPPMQLSCPISVHEDGVTTEDEEDPDIPVEEFEDDVPEEDAE
jgi:TIR domain